jgi:hypothetical protein
MTGIVSIRKALETYLAAMPGGIATAWENNKFTPVAGTPYQVVTLMLADPLNLEWGNSYSEVGYLQVQLRYPIEQGTRPAFLQAQAIRDYFRKQLNLSADGVNVVVNRAPTIGNGVIDGDRYAVTVKIRFFSNNTG